LSTVIYENLYQEELYQIRSTIVVVIPRDWASTSDEEKVLLSKILGSVKLNTARVQIISKASLSSKSLKFLAPTKVLIFGAAVEGDIKPYENHIIDGISVIKAEDLRQLDDVKKKNLWLALRQMFGV
jgi:hypothetical protein